MRILILFLLMCSALKGFAQNFPWERPLRACWSSDGINFGPTSIFQDSAGVPSVIRWKGDTLVSTFQWFRMPVSSLIWDRVAVKFSYDNGNSWTQPEPMTFAGFPTNFRRPFDPTLVAFGDTMRVYFSSGQNGAITLDSTVNTYSAFSLDGINYTFDNNSRVDEINNRVIDPALIFFNNSYHYLSPIGSPAQGAYHYVSPNGINFTKVPDIPSDATHNWTGNYMVNDTNSLRFYGAGGAGIWFNSSPNGGMWNGYINTNVQGGDPTVVRIDATTYLMIFVGEPYATALEELNQVSQLNIYPNPSNTNFTIDLTNFYFAEPVSNLNYQVADMNGKICLSEAFNFSEQLVVNGSSLAHGSYVVLILSGNKPVARAKISIER
jgi:hypothetical protein